jgi:hypothetical protein
MKETISHSTKLASNASLAAGYDDFLRGLPCRESRNFVEPTLQLLPFFPVTV